MNLLTESSIMSVAAKELGTSEAETRLGLSLADLVSTLEGTKLTQQQRLVAAATTAIARKCDDLFDTTPLEQMDPRQALVDAIEGKEAAEVLDPHLAQFAKIAGENMNEAAHGALRDIAQVQIESLKQRNPNISIHEVRDVTEKKGSLYMLLFALNISPNLTPARKKCWEALGYLFQLIDDFEDEQQDRMEGIITLVTMSPEKTEAAIALMCQRNKVQALFTNEYALQELTPLFDHIDRLMARIGFLN